MHSKTRRLSPFDARSVLLFTALALGGTAALRAQTTHNSPTAPSFGPAPAATQPATPTAPQKYVIGPAAQADVAFDKADANHDGRLSAQEAGTLPAIGNQFQQLDADRDGALSRAEFHKGAKN